MNKILEVYNSKVFQRGMDVCRILLLVVAILIFYKLVTEIEAVKTLQYDPCKICMNKTGSLCFYPNSSGTVVIQKVELPQLDVEKWRDILINETKEKV